MKLKFLALSAISLSVFADVNLEELTRVKSDFRRNLVKSSSNKSIILYGDRAEDLVDNPQKMIRDLKTMETKSLLDKKLTNMPWSDNYWPIYQGMLGIRYNDPEMSYDNWKDNHDYILANPAQNLIAEDNIDLLSPSEKYDYLFGSNTFTLTKYNWREGKQYFDDSGKVETWMGLCHGWAPASYMLPTPKKAVEVKTLTGTKVTFYPSDIKALGTLLWAQTQVPTKFIGGRCNTKNPKKDSLGRAIEEDCLDNNPGTWHLSIVNQIGVFDRSFVMDATYDYEVWNQPVYSYQYSYYNPMTKENFEKLEDAIVSINDFQNDPRKTVRAPKTKFIVGINMTLKYVMETVPNTNENQENLLQTVKYTYDLELDEKTNIIGGEWYSKAHPDFLWTPELNASPKTSGDDLVPSVLLNNLPGMIRPIIEKNSLSGVPFAPFVRQLFLESSK